MENPSVPNVGTWLKAFCGSAIVGLFVCVVLGGLSASGVVSMLATHVLFAIATVVAVIGVVTPEKIFRQRRWVIILSGIVTFLLVGSGLFALDRLLAHERNELDSLSSPPLARLPAPPSLFPSPNSASAKVNQQQVGGKNNVQTGPITQGSGSALSFNQQGGVTAGTFNVNTGWNLTDEQEKTLRSRLSAFPNPPEVALVYEAGANNNALTSELQDVFNKSRWHVAVVQPTTQMKLGIHIETSVTDNPAATLVQTNLESMLGEDIPIIVAGTGKGTDLSFSVNIHERSMQPSQ